VIVLNCTFCCWETKGKPIELDPEAEEMATFFAKYIGTHHFEKKLFRDNFFCCFLKVLNHGKEPNEKHLITKLDLCDFGPIVNHLKDDSELRRNRTKEERNQEREEKNSVKDKFGFAFVDGSKQMLQGWKIQPPGLFVGRGSHPKAGMHKYR